MQQLTESINLDAEVKAMAAFIGQKWTPIQGIEALFLEIRDAALYDARAWIDQYDVSDAVHTLCKEREEMLKANNVEGADSAFVYDGVCHFLSHVSLRIGALLEEGRNVDGPWDYSRKVDRVHDRLAKVYPDLLVARPLGWDALAKGYSDFDGQEEYHPKADRELFQGTRVEGACSSDFPGRTALPYVMYDEKCQGYKASRVLVGAVYAQFLGIASWLNARKLVKELTAIPALQAPEMVFDFSVTSDNPFMQVLIRTADAGPSKADWLESQGHKRAFEALPLEEQEARKTANRAAVLESMKTMFSSGPNPEFEARQAARKAVLVAAIQEVFGR